MFGRQTLIVSPDTSTGLEPILADYCSSFGNNCFRKKESELTEADYAKDILLAGVVNQLKHWPQLKTPIKLTSDGFIINNKPFTHKNDGFGYIDSNRIILIGNSLNAVKNVHLALTGGHDILIVQDGKITYFGNRKDSIFFSWFNLQDLKQANYYKKTSKIFSSIYVSKTFKDSINYLKLYKNLIAYVRQFISIYKLKVPIKKFDWFIHSNMTEYGTMSGMFGLTCPGNNSAGFSIREEIHTNGVNTGLVKHEYSHFLFDSYIPQDKNPAFFIEGCVEYVTNLNDKELYKKRITIAKEFRDSLKYTDLIINNQDFYGQYSDGNYSISGVFVKYLIDKFGVEKFKNYCLTADKKNKTKNIFKIDFDQLVAGYKNWLDGQ